MAGELVAMGAETEGIVQFPKDEKQYYVPLFWLLQRITCLLMVSTCVSVSDAKNKFIIFVATTATEANCSQCWLCMELQEATKNGLRWRIVPVPYCIPNVVCISLTNLTL